jgi:cytochrome d ubiquinol oxidase subunit II
MTAEALVSLVALVAIALYAIFGGADFGGGVLDIAASGPRRDEQRMAIARAIGPVWETNHVWLIFCVVLLFTCFPPAFASLAVGLYFPLTFALVGIILRGAAFAFRSQQYRSAPMAQFWGRVFGIASLVTPFFFGTCVGGLTQGHYAWTSPFAIAIGLFAVTLGAQIAAVFLTLETTGNLRDDFRIRALVATFALAGAGALALGIAALTVPATFEALVSPQALPGIGAAMFLGFVVLGLVWTRHFATARIAVALEAVAILVGWYASQTPYLIPGEMTYTQAAAPEITLHAFLWIVAAGGALLVPSLFLLFRIFKSELPARSG